MSGKLNIQRVRQNHAERKAKESRGDYWKPGPGTNLIRLALFASPVTGNEEYSRTIKVHQDQNAPPEVCGKSPDRNGKIAESCDRCEQAVRVKEEDGKEAARAMWARERTVFLILPLEKANKPFKNQRLYQFWAASTVASAIDSILADCDEVADVRDYFGPQGLDFKITFNPKATPMEMYQVKVMPKAKCQNLDPALFAKADEMDLFQANNLEPAGFSAPEKPAAPAPEEPAAPPPPPKRGKTPGPGVPGADGMFDLPNAKQYLAYYGFDVEGWRTTTDEGGVDAYFVAPSGEPTWDPPEVSAEREARARGMTPTKNRKPAPQASDGEDNADTE